MQKEQYSIECPKHAVCICLSSTLLVIGPENSRHSLNQSNLRVKPIALESPAFSRAWRQLHVLALNLSFAQVGRCDYFSFGFMTLKGGAFIVALETRWTYISIFKGSASDGKSNCRMVFIIQLTIGCYVSVRSSRYEALGKFGEHERCVRVARGVAEMRKRCVFSQGICLLTSWACTIGIWSTLAQLNLITQIY